MNLVAQDRQVAYAVVLLIALVAMMIVVLSALASSPAPSQDSFGVIESRYNTGTEENIGR